MDQTIKVNLLKILKPRSSLMGTAICWRDSGGQDKLWSFSVGLQKLVLIHQDAICICNKQAQVAVIHCYSHQKGVVEVVKENNKADLLSNHVALGKVTFQMPLFPSPPHANPTFLPRFTLRRNGKRPPNGDIQKSYHPGGLINPHGQLFPEAVAL